MNLTKLVSLKFELIKIHTVPVSQRKAGIAGNYISIFGIDNLEENRQVDHKENAGVTSAKQRETENCFFVTGIAKNCAFITI